MKPPSDGGEVVGFSVGTGFHTAQGIQLAQGFTRRGYLCDLPGDVFVGHGLAVFVGGFVVGGGARE